MDLEAVAAKIRPREPYEAIDLGFGLARNFHREIWLPWLVCVVPLQILVIGVLWFEHALLAMTVLWFLHPLFERLPLFVLSRALFGATPKVRDVIRAFPKMLWRQLFWAITLQRFDPRRAFRLPVWELEGLPHAQRRRRLKVLDRGQETPAFVLGFLCHCMVWGIAFGTFWLLAMLIPSQTGFNLWEELGRAWPDAFPVWLSILAWACYLFAVMVVSPLYVAGGFALYINRRTHLEGWDVQLAFQRLAKRLEKLESKEPNKRNVSDRLGAVALLLCMGLALGGVSHAQGLEDVPIGPEPTPAAKSAEDTSDKEPEPEEVLEEVFKRDEFGGKRQSQTRQLKKGPSDAINGFWNRTCGMGGPGGGGGCSPAGPGGGVDMQGLCMLIGSAMGAALVIAMVAWLFRYRARLSLLTPDASEKEREGGVVVPEVLMGLDLRKESLPDDVAKAAAAAHAQGNAREALSLLYRGALSHLIPELELKIDASATEGDCLREVKRARGPADFFGRLTTQWQLVAYAHREADGEEIAALCEAYDRAIGGGKRRRRR